MAKGESLAKVEKVSKEKLAIVVIVAFFWSVTFRSFGVKG
jgi:hypothetical protein